MRQVLEPSAQPLGDARLEAPICRYPVKRPQGAASLEAPMALLRFNVWLAFVLFFALLACRRDGPAAPPNFSARVAEQLLGAPAEVAFLLDLAALRRDPVYSRMISDRRLGDDSDLRWLVRRIDRIDVWLLDIHGSAKVLRRPRRAAQRSPRRGRLRPGRRQDRPRPPPRPPDRRRHARRREPPLRTAIFLVDGDLVLAAGAAIAPTQNHFSGSRTLPPSIDWGRDALAGITAAAPRSPASAPTTPNTRPPRASCGAPATAARSSPAPPSTTTPAPSKALTARRNELPDASVRSIRPAARPCPRRHRHRARPAAPSPCASPACAP
jgi:hypothetical protein